MKAGYPGNVPAYRHFLSNDPALVEPSKESLRMACESLAKRIDKHIPSFFGRIPRITYGIASLTEAASEHLPPAYAQPNPADRTAAGIFWLTALPRRCPRYMLLPLTLHEAWPGHLMHLALLQEMQNLPAFRRHGALKYTAYVEGWALYCESLGVEMGLYETPHQHYGRLEMVIWRALRMVVDTAIHWLGWSRERAIETMLQHMAIAGAFWSFITVIIGLILTPVLMTTTRAVLNKATFFSRVKTPLSKYGLRSKICFSPFSNVSKRQ